MTLFVRKVIIFVNFSIFHLVLRPISRDTPTFAEDFKVFMNNTHHVIRPNLFLYQGYVKGKLNSANPLH